VAAKIGNTRAGVIKLCLSSFLEAFERDGKMAMPVDWMDVLESLDGRTKVSKARAEKALPPGREFSDDQIAAMAKTAVGVMVKGKRRRDERARRTRIKQRREPLGTETPHPDHLAGGQ
jgi:hypothetical protein